MTPNLRFPLASVSKLFAGYLLLDLVDDGKLGLDDRIGEYFPEWATETWNPTIRQVAAHRSGLFNPVSDRAFQDRVMRSPERIWTDRELLTFALERTGSDKQGEFHYSNASTSSLCGRRGCFRIRACLNPMPAATGTVSQNVRSDMGRN